MGNYTEQERTMNGRSVYVGGRDDDTAVWFDANNSIWIVCPEEEVGGTGFSMCVQDSAAAPELIEAPWLVSVGKQPTPSVQFSEFKKQDDIMKLAGLSPRHRMACCMGYFTKQARTHDSKPTYKGGQDGKWTVWFVKETGAWCVGNEEQIGTVICSMYAKDSAPTPDAVLSTWLVQNSPDFDDRVKVCSASQPTTSYPQQRSSAPPKLALVGLDTNSHYAGVYSKQQRKENSRAVYKGGRDGTQAIWFTEGGWRVGDMKMVGTHACYMFVMDTAINPVAIDLIKHAWEVPVMEPSNVRVTKSKKKNTKVIELKGVSRGLKRCEPSIRPVSAESWDEYLKSIDVLNGKYRQQARIVGGRPTFKGGQDGNRTFWYDENDGKWRVYLEIAVGTGVCVVEAKDTALTPNAVKATWQVLTDYKRSSYPNIIMPSVEAAAQEVPRLMQLKMGEMMAAQHRRCLGCGYEYTTQAEVVFQRVCMHHHCVCCGDNLGDGVCVVCAEDVIEEEEEEDDDDVEDYATAEEGGGEKGGGRKRGSKEEV
jgi:hypothetical protein